MNTYNLPGECDRLREVVLSKNGDEVMLRGFEEISLYWDSTRGDYPLSDNELLAIMGEGEAIFKTSGNAPFVGVMVDAQRPFNLEFGAGPPDVVLIIQPLRYWEK